MPVLAAVPALTEQSVLGLECWKHPGLSWEGRGALRFGTSSSRLLSPRCHTAMGNPGEEQGLEMGAGTQMGWERLRRSAPPALSNPRCFFARVTLTQPMPGLSSRDRGMQGAHAMLVFGQGLCGEHTSGTAGKGMGTIRPQPHAGRKELCAFSHTQECPCRGGSCCCGVCSASTCIGQHHCRARPLLRAPGCSKTRLLTGFVRPQLT